MAADRTLMAWVRTALSMFSFGFTIYKFLEAAAEQEALARPESPQKVGLFLAAVGTLSMVFGIVSYLTTLIELQKAEPFRFGRPSLVIAVIMAMAGVALFAVIASRAI